MVFVSQSYILDEQVCIKCVYLKQILTAMVNSFTLYAVESTFPLPHALGTLISAAKCRYEFFLPFPAKIISLTTWLTTDI